MKTKDIMLSPSHFKCLAELHQWTHQLETDIITSIITDFHSKLTHELL